MKNQDKNMSEYMRLISEHPLMKAGRPGAFFRQTTSVLDHPLLTLERPQIKTQHNYPIFDHPLLHLKRPK